MKVKARFKRIVGHGSMRRLLNIAEEIKPIYQDVTDKTKHDKISAFTAINNELESGRLGNFSIRNFCSYKDNTFSLSIGSYTESTNGIETIEIKTDDDIETNEWYLEMYLECDTKRSSFRKHLRPILTEFCVHPNDLEVIEIDDSSKRIPWWMTKGEYAVALVKGILDGVSTKEQFDRAVKLINKAARLEARYRSESKKLPRWVKEFHDGLTKIEDGIDPKIKRTLNALYLWDKFSDALQEQSEYTEATRTRVNSIEDII